MDINALVRHGAGYIEEMDDKIISARSSAKFKIGLGVVLAVASAASFSFLPTVASPFMYGLSIGISVAICVAGIAQLEAADAMGDVKTSLEGLLNMISNGR